VPSLSILSDDNDPFLRGGGIEVTHERRLGELAAVRAAGLRNSLFTSPRIEALTSWGQHGHDDPGARRVER
jgi:hypothetical protein